MGPIGVGSFWSLLEHYFTVVPIFSPLTALTIFSGSAIPNTTSGILLSLHNAVAV